MSSVATRWLPAIECAPWCAEGDGHPNEWHPADQVCQSVLHTIKLSRHPLVKMSDDQWVPEWAEVQIVREHEARTHVALGALGKFPDVELTPDEALEIARATHPVRHGREGREGASTLGSAPLTSAEPPPASVAPGVVLCLSTS